MVRHYIHTFFPEQQTETTSSSTDTRVPLGLPHHLSDIYLEELDKAMATTSEKTLPAPLNSLLKPFVSLMALTSSSVTYKRVQSSLLEPLLEALTPPPPSTSDEPNAKRIRREPNSYTAVISNACFEHPETSGALDRVALKKKLLRTVFEVASRPDTKDSSRRKMYAMWNEGGEDEDEEERRSN